MDYELLGALKFHIKNLSEKGEQLLQALKQGDDAEIRIATNDLEVAVEVAKRLQQRMEPKKESLNDKLLAIFEGI